jgi:hypothetical protein
VNQEIHPNGYVLSRVRRRGLTGKDPRLCFLEWSVDDDAYNTAPEQVIRDPKHWAVANPALGSSRLSVEYIESELGALSVQGFATERLGVGDWPSEDGGEEVIPMETWNSLVAKPTSVQAPLVFAIDMPPHRNTASIASCRYLPGKRKFVEVLPRPTTAKKGTAWLVGEARRLQERWNPTCWIVDRLGPAAGVVDALREPYARDGQTMPGLRVEITDGGALAIACGDFYDDAVNGSLRHGNQLQLTSALRAVSTRKLLDRWAWSRAGVTDISPLVAATLARYGLVKFGVPKVVAAPVVEATGREVTSDDLMALNF